VMNATLPSSRPTMTCSYQVKCSSRRLRGIESVKRSTDVCVVEHFPGA